MLMVKDQKLLTRFRDGEKDALEEVYHAYNRIVLSFLRRGFTFRSKGRHLYFRGIQDNGELHSYVQEVFRRSFEDKARNAYNGISSFKNWVLAISRNMVINSFRNREVAMSSYITKDDSGGHTSFMDKQMSEDYSGLLYGQQADSQDRAYETNELKELIGEFMKQLTETEQKLLIYRFAEGRGQHEAADLTGLTRMKVRTIESKLRTRLRAFMRHSGYTDHMPKAND